ncbi:MAG: hypothetical protein U0263_37575 [Polyangiaceae bacterium]
MRRIFALAIALMLLFPAGSVSAQAFFCHMRGQVTAKCCCGDQAKDEDTPSGPSASQGTCCDSRTLSASADRRTLTSSAELPAIPAPVVLAVLPVIDFAALPVERVEAAPPRARGPPRPAPAPLFILHRSFLS